MNTLQNPKSNHQSIVSVIGYICWIILIMLNFEFTRAQSLTDTLSREQKIEAWKSINADIWKPFSDAFATANAELYIGLHTKDFLRISRDGIQTKDGFAARSRAGFERGKKENRPMNIDFRLLERIVSPDYASERGIFRTTVNAGRANERSFYGKFHVVFRKENGTWKIIMDYDSNENGTITMTSFEQAYRIDDFEKYLK